MPRQNISDRDLAYLRRASLDRDGWAGVEVEYEVVDETTTSFDRVTKETEIADWDYASPVRLSAFISVQAFSQPHSSIHGHQSMGPEHTVNFRFGLRQLEEAGVTPKPKDRIRVQGVYYLVWAVPKEKILKHSPFNIDVYVQARREHSLEGNGGLPFDTNPDVY